MADRLRTTLHAVAGDEALRDALSEGRLSGEAQAGGAWPFALEPSAEPPPKPRPRPSRPRRRSRRRPRSRPRTSRPPSARPRRARPPSRPRASVPRREARKALEKELRDARSSLRVRERVLAGAEEDANDAAARIGDAQDALEAAAAGARGREVRGRGRPERAHRGPQRARPGARPRRRARGAAGLMDPRLEPLSAICLALPEAERVDPRAARAVPGPQAHVRLLPRRPSRRRHRRPDVQGTAPS